MLYGDKELQAELVGYTTIDANTWLKKLQKRINIKNKFSDTFIQSAPYKENAYKTDIYQLGMVLLSLSLLIFPSEIFVEKKYLFTSQKKVTRQDLLNQKLIKVNDKYNNRWTFFIMKLLTKDS